MRIFDTFMFFNELDLLEIRLHVLNDVVDRFVLVESTRDHAGRDKPLHFGDHRDRFAPFLDKIEHVVVDDMPRGDGREAGWKRENHQRRCIERGLHDAEEHDVVMVSDLDEIPRPGAVQQALERDGLVFFEQSFHCYFLNCRVPGAKWRGTGLTRFGRFKDAQRVRDLRDTAITWRYRHLPPRLSTVEDGGWHFTFLGGVDAIIHKIESFAHSEFNRPELKSRERILARIEEGKDLFLSEEEAVRFEFVELDDSFPSYLRDHADRYPELVYEPRR